MTIDADSDYDKYLNLGGSTIGLPELNIGTPIVDVTVGSLTVNLGNLANALLAPLKWVLTGDVNNPSDGVLGVLDAKVLNPLLTGLGVDVSGYRIKVARTPSCGTPALRG